MEIGSHRPLHVNVTAHPTAEGTLQQFREALPGGHSHRFLLHDRDSIYSRHLDESIEALGVEVLRTPRQAPKVNADAERLIGTLRRECLDFLIPSDEKHLRRLLKKSRRHYNRGRPHSSLGPGFPETTKDPDGTTTPSKPPPQGCSGRRAPNPRRRSPPEVVRRRESAAGRCARSGRRLVATPEPLEMPGPYGTSSGRAR